MKYSKISISNAAAPTGEIGGTYSHSYQYDELNRLISASGKAKDKNYELLMRYDVMSNPLQKDSVTYEYNTPNHPNAVSSAGGKLFTYDANGNPISVEDTTANTLRVMQWDEENRLQSLGDDGYVSRYTYNHAGERVIKSHGPTTVAFVNGAPQGILWHDKDNWTMYVSPYMVVNSDRFTKHYYAGSQRIASKIGAGEFNNLYDASKACVTAGQKDYAERLNLITQSRNDYYAALGIPPGPPTAKGIYGEAEYCGVYGEYVIEPLGDYGVPTGWPMKPYKRPYGGTPGPPVMYEKPSDPEDEAAGYGYSNGMSQQERDVFYYHSDHLGSTSYITDRDGNATQFVCYKPYGEALVDEHATSFESPWKFNGKELDSETGLYYYGARYYEPVSAMWYGVDALAEKYPSMGGYVYCAGNPVKLVDVDGRKIVITNEDGTVLEYSVGMEYQGNDDFVKETVEYLNAMSEVKAGYEVLSYVSDSEKRFNFVNAPSKAGSNSFQFVKYKSGNGGNIRASAFLVSNMSEANKVEGVSHELFHAYQFINGRNFASANAEVEAYLFGNGVAANSKFGSEYYPYVSGNLSQYGRKYEESMLLLIADPQDFSKFFHTFSIAVENFQKGNISSYRDKYRSNIDVQYVPLIQQFLPLR